MPSHLHIAIQGELGSNSHMAVLALVADLGIAYEIVPCDISADVFEHLLRAPTDRESCSIFHVAALPIENTLHGSVAEHYDLLLEHPVKIVRECLLRIRFHLIAMPGAQFGDLRRVLSHPVALAQCRRFLAANRQLEAMPFYDTAGSVKHLMQLRLPDTAGIAPELAALEYGAQIVVRDLEDHAENFTRFHLVCRADMALDLSAGFPPDKMTIAFAVEHRPGTLVEALRLLSATGVDLTRIESRPVPGVPWEYVFYVEFRFADVTQAETALSALREHCKMVKELGRYRGSPVSGH